MRIPNAHRRSKDTTREIFITNGSAEAQGRHSEWNIGTMAEKAKALKAMKPVISFRITPLSSCWAFCDTYLAHDFEFTYNTRKESIKWAYLKLPDRSEIVNAFTELI